MKISGKDLGMLIREIVEDELKKVLPRMIEKHLTESYLKKIVSENSSRRGIREVMQGEEEREVEVTPEALSNEDESIYGEMPLMKGKQSRQNESVSVLLSKNNPLSFMYEGTTPAPRGDTVYAGQSTPDVPLDSFGDDFMKRMTKLAPKITGAEQKKRNESMEEKMKELEERRKRLDVPVPVVKG
jgi:hypothetical protein